MLPLCGDHECPTSSLPHLDPSWPVRLQRAKALTLLFVYKFHISSFRERDAITKNRKLLQFLLTEKKKNFCFLLIIVFFLSHKLHTFIYLFFCCYFLVNFYWDFTAASPIWLSDFVFPELGHFFDELEEKISAHNRHGNFEDGLIDHFCNWLICLVWSGYWLLSVSFKLF